MSRLRAPLAALAFLGASIVAHAVDSLVPPGAEPVRLEHPTIGCASRAVLARIAMLLHEKGEAALDQQNCQRFNNFHGDVVKETEYYACVRTQGSTQCLWFQRSAFVADQR